MSDNKNNQDEKYLQELKRLRDHETKNKRVKTFLNSEILASEKRMKYHELLSKKKQILKKLQLREELLEDTSSTVFREDLQQSILTLKKEVHHLTAEIIKREMTKAEFKNRLIQCEEMLAVTLFSLSDEREFEKQTTKAAKIYEESPWLMICKAKTGLDTHQSGLPTTTLTKHAFDESDEYAKIYVDVPGLRESDKNKLKPKLSERDFSLLVADVGGKNYEIRFTNLTEAVNVENSKIRPKKDRVVVFLKKKQRTTWRNLTAVGSSSKKTGKSVEEIQAFLSSFTATFQALAICGSEDQKKRVMLYKGYYSLLDVPSAKEALAQMNQFPPKFCNFKWHDKSPGAEKILRKAIQAIAQRDCFVSWAILRSWAERRLHFDDEHIETLTSGECQLMNFTGRLSTKGWSLMPSSVLEVTAIITCADDIRALSTCPSVFEKLFVCFDSPLPLNKLKPLRPSTSEQPITLMFCHITDAHAEWVLKAVAVLLPLTALPILQRAKEEFQVLLSPCNMSVAGHSRLCRGLPPDVVKVTVHDITSSPKIEALGGMYEARGCAYSYEDINADEELRRVL